MGIFNVAILLLISTARAVQPEGVSNTIYDCKYDSTKSVYLNIEFDGELYKCGESGTIEAQLL